MGLDMYLNARRFFWFNEDKPVVEGHEIKEAIVEAAYWRKANAVHDWFVKNVQNGEDECRPHYVTNEQLTELRDTCVRVLADHSLAPDLLPTQSGCFFGSTEYDDGYFEDLQQTVEQIDAALSKFDLKKWDFEYRSSW